MRSRKWTIEQLKDVASTSFSYRSVIKKLGLKPAGGNYKQITKYLKENSVDTTHFRGKGWNKGKLFDPKPKILLNLILKQDSDFQSHKLKKRLLLESVKIEACEECHWSESRDDGSIPLELHHINGDPRDNRLENLQILCPNCHSLKLNHRGRNIKK